MSKLRPRIDRPHLAIGALGDLSAIVVTPDAPRGTIVALHGGGMRSLYWNAPHRPSLSFALTAASRGWRVVAVDRPGYGASAGLAHLRLRAKDQVPLIQAAVRLVIGDAPVAIAAHSLGSIVAAHAAAGAWEGEITAIALHGVPLAYLPEQESALDLINTSGPWARRTVSDGPLNLETMFGPQGTWDRRLPDHFRAIMASTPSGEMEDARTAPLVVPSLLPLVAAPIRIDVGALEQATAPAEVIATLAKTILGTRTGDEVNIVPGGPHNISLSNVAAPFHQSVLTFLESDPGNLARPRTPL